MTIDIEAKSSLATKLKVKQETKTTKPDFETVENISKRQAVVLKNIEAASQSKRRDIDKPIVWFDTKNLAKATPKDDIYSRIVNLDYSGIQIYLANVDALFESIPKRMKVILKLNSAVEINEFKKSKYYDKFKNDESRRLVISLSNMDVLLDLKEQGFSVCYNCFVDDNESLHSSIYDGLQADFLSILFKDPTNIPLELVIASLQKTGTILMKEISSPKDVDDAIVTLGVMEFGAEGVIFSPTEHAIIDEFAQQLASRQHPDLSLQVGTVKSTKPVGMGYRACIDTGTLFDDDEGMLIGSTSQGGILCCPEVYFLPYMELRPFRVNAGAVHSYVYNTDDRTDYMSELKAGSSVMLVNSKGRVRTAPVGRMKIEQRPLRIIEVEFANGINVNVVMQDDWHVRIFSDKAKPLNISALVPGDKVLGYVTEPGRHVGIRIDENIIER